MHRLSLLVVSLLLTTSLIAGEIVVKGAWVREAPPGAKALGGFMILKNLGERERYLVSASAPHFDEVMLHRTVIEGDIARMVHQTQVAIPADGRIEFRPGGYHLMLMRPDRRFVAGEQIDLTLKFGDGEEQPIAYKVLKGMGEGMNHDNH